MALVIRDYITLKNNNTPRGILGTSVYVHLQLFCLREANIYVIPIDLLQFEIYVC